jgi:hypothetical protein
MQHLHAALEQQPQTTCQALEVAVRGSNPSELLQCSILACCCLELCGRNGATDSSINITDSRIQQPLVPKQHAFSLQISCLKLIRAAAAAAAAVGLASSAQSAADSSSSSSSELLATQAAVTASVVAQAADCYRDSLQAAAAVSTTPPAATGCATTSGPASSTGSVASSSSSAAAMSPEGSTSYEVLLLTAGCFAAAGTALAAVSVSLQGAMLSTVASPTAAAQPHSATNAATNSGGQPQLNKATWQSLTSCFRDCLEGAAFVHTAISTWILPGGCKVPAVMQQRLVQELQQLQQEAAAAAAAQAALGCNSKADAAEAAAGAATNGSASSSSSSNSTETFAALLPGLGGRLVACGEALAALCPVPLCCNNPGCVELRGASELQMVAGKGSVCSRCR